MSNFVATLRDVTVLFALAAVAAWGQLNSSGNTLAGANEIEQGLEQVQVAGSALMIAAHPDDENTAVLAWLARGRHRRTGYLSLTRGEGGQNLIGPEQGDALGVIRTHELLDARGIDGAEQFFTRAIDFGFSKSPKEAISKWGHDEILSDIVWVIRRFQPDVIILRFSGTPEDGHGHHQASAILGKEAYEAAADPARFPEQMQWVKPWRAKRLVWNAFSFNAEQEKKVAGMPAKITNDVGVFNPVLGRSYGEIASLSRSQHRSQGMGVPLQRGPSLSYFTPVGGASAHGDLFDDIDTGWSRIENGRPIGELLARAQREFSPEHPELIVPMLADARRQLAALPADNLWVQQKRGQVDRLLALCSGLWIDAACDRGSAFPGDSVKVTVTALKRLPDAVRWTDLTLRGLGETKPQKVDAALANDEPLTREITVRIPDSTAYSQPFWLIEPHHVDRYTISDQQLIGRAAPLPVLSAALDFDIAGAPTHLEIPVQFRYVDHVRGELLRPFEIVPEVAIDLPERAVIFPRGEERRVVVQVRANAPSMIGDLKLSVPAGWTATTDSTAFHLDLVGDQQEFSFLVKPPANGTTARAEFRATATVKGHEIATGMQQIAYEHIPPQVIFRPSDGVLQPLNLRVLAKNVGYIMGAGDRVPEAIRQMGCTVTLLSDDDLLRGNLDRFDAIVTGVRAYNVRENLHAAHARLLDYVRGGGTLVVQYNVLEFNRFAGVAKQPGPLGPYTLEISSERVTEEDSPLTMTNSKSPLLNAPNVIGPDDFTGWIQERGLYFAKKWDPQYQTVMATHDTGEKDLPGGMLYARYGKGAYIFTAYAWFRELPAGVPGAYRIFANLLSAGKAAEVKTAVRIPKE